MPSSTAPELDAQARLVWKPARNHSWGTPITADALVRLAATDEDHDEMRHQLKAVLDLPFVVRGPDGIYIPNGQDTHVAAANWLRENTNRPDFVIATPSLDYRRHGPRRTPTPSDRRLHEHLFRMAHEYASR